jgi:hypothetical protein
MAGHHKCPSLLQFRLSSEFVHHAEVMRDYQSQVIRKEGKRRFFARSCGFRVTVACDDSRHSAGRRSICGAQRSRGDSESEIFRDPPDISFYDHRDVDFPGSRKKASA